MLRRSPAHFARATTTKLYLYAQQLSPNIKMDWNLKIVDDTICEEVFYMYYADCILCLIDYWMGIQFTNMGNICHIVQLPPLLEYKTQLSRIAFSLFRSPVFFFCIFAVYRERSRHSRHPQSPTPLLVGWPRCGPPLARG